MKGKRFNWIWLGGLVALLALGAVGGAAWAQGAGPKLSIEGVDAKKYPEVQLVLSVENGFGVPILNMKPDQLTITEDGQPVRSLQVKAEPGPSRAVDYVLVFDNSASMTLSSDGKTLLPAAEQPYTTAREIAKKMIEDLGPHDRMEIIAFGYNYRDILKEKPKFELTDAKDKLIARISALPAGGLGGVNQAIIDALELLSTSNKRKAVVVIADDADNMLGGKPFENVVAELEKNKAPVYFLGFAEAKKDEMKTLAATSGGKQIFAEKITDLIVTLPAWQKELHQQYAVTYTSILAADNKAHTVKVNYKVGEVATSMDATYTPPKLEMVISGITEGKEVSGVVKLDVVANADQPIEKVEISLDGKLLHSGKLPTLGYDWDTTPLASGEHKLTFKLTNGNGAFLEKIYKVSVAVPVTVTGTPGEKPAGPNSGEPANGAPVGQWDPSVLFIVGIVVLALGLVLAGVVVALTRRARRPGSIPAGAGWPAPAAPPAPGNWQGGEPGLAKPQPMPVVPVQPAPPVGAAPVWPGSQPDVYAAQPPAVAPAPGWPGAPQPPGPLSSQPPLRPAVQAPPPAQVSPVRPAPPVVPPAQPPVQPAMKSTPPPMAPMPPPQAPLPASRPAPEPPSPLSTQVRRAAPPPAPAGPNRPSPAPGTPPPPRSLGDLSRGPGQAPVPQPVQPNPGMLFLVYGLTEVEGLNPGRQWPLGAADITAGRLSDENDIPLKGMTASRNHFLIRNARGQHFIETLKPENPALVNDQPVMDQRLLAPGDRIRAGESLFIYEQLGKNG